MDNQSLIDNFFNNSSQSARQQVFNNSGENPDNAARAVDLSQATGVPAEAIHGDLENFENDTRAQAAGAIVEGNPLIQQYLNAHPMAARVSNDDYANLDTFSQKLSRAYQLWSTVNPNMASWFRATKEVAGENIQSLSEAPGKLLGAERQDDPALRETIRFSFLAHMQGEDYANQRTEQVLRSMQRQQGFQDITMGLPMLLIAPIIGGARAFVSEPIEHETGLPKEAVEQYLMIAGAALGLRGMAKEYRAQQRTLDTAGHREFADQLREKLGLIQEEARGAADAAHPYTSAGREPPVGTHPFIDKLKVEQTKQGMEILDELMSDAQSSTTRERAPQMHQDFSRLHGNGEVSIPFEAIAELYKDKMPTPDDNVLGWVPNIHDQLVSAAVTGGDIRIPLADWLARVDPKVAKDLHDHIRIERSLPTIAEGEVIKELASVEGEGRRPEPTEQPVDPNNEAVNAVRQQAGLEPPPELPHTTVDRFLQNMRDVYNEVRPQEEVQVARRTKVTVPKELLSHEKEIVETVDRVLAELGIKAETKGILRGTMDEVGGISGAYIGLRNKLPLILYALRDDAVGIVRHEAIHYLKDQGFFTREEWATLEKAAVDEGWLDKDRGDGRGSVRSAYPKDTPILTLLEEAIADEFKWWASHPNDPHIAAKVFRKLREFLERLKDRITRLRTTNPEVAKIFNAIESGELTKRTPDAERGYAERASADKPVQGELDVTRQEDKKLFARAAAIGMTEPQYRKYLEKIKQQSAEDAEYIRGKALEAERKRQTREWKENEVRVHDEVEQSLRNRPDISAVNFFRYGELNGEKTGTRPRLDEALLTKEQKAQLPEHWYGKEGMHPDDAANFFGYTDAQSMIDRIQAFEAARGETAPGKFFDQLAKAETERRMQSEYGELQANILSAAEDHVLGTTQMDLLHEETVALGMRAGDEISFSKADVQRWVDDRFGQALAGKVDTVRILNEAGKAGRLAELALLKEDFKEAFKYKQQQYFAAAMAREAKKFEKERARFDRLVKRYSRREVTGVDQASVDAIQSLLNEAGFDMKRSPADLLEGLQRAGFDGVQQYVNGHRGDGWEMVAEPWVLSTELRQKAGAGFNVEDFRDFHEALRSMNHIGREVLKKVIAGEKEDFNAFKIKVMTNISQLPPRTDPRNRNIFQKIGHLLWSWDAQMARMEEIVKDLDLRRAGGPLFSNIIRPMAEAKHTEYSMLEDLSKRLKELRGGNKAWRKTLDDTIPQDFLMNPREGVPFDMTREHMINIMLNWGTESSIEKFTRGYFGKDHLDGRAKLEDLFRRHANKEDWEFVQNMIDIFKPWRKAADEMYYQLSGVPPKWLEPTGMTHPHGKFEGGYWPVVYDQWLSDINAIREKNSLPEGSLFNNNYVRFTPGNSYTKTRTGYVDFMDFQQPIEGLASRMQQAIHDIAYRRQIMDVAKIIKDKDIAKMVRWHYGEEYERQLMPWLKKIASHFQMDETAVSASVSFMRRLRFNLMAHALGGSLKMLGSPDISTFNPATWGPALWSPKEAVRMAYENSKEIPHTFRNMDRDYRERLELVLANKGVDGFVGDAVRWSFWPIVKISQGFRIATFNHEFSAAKAKGMDDGAAAAHADSVVRERHGSAGLPDLPSIMTSNEAMKLWTMFYGFQNTMYNWARQIPGNLRRGEYMKAAANTWGAVLIPSAFGIALYNQVRESDSWWKTIAKGLLIQPLSTLVFANVAANFFIEGFPQRTPLMSALQSVKTLSTDIQKSMKGQRVDKPITHTANVIGLTTGLPLAQAGRTAQFARDVSTGKQRPRNILEWVRGVIQGEARLKK